VTLALASALAYAGVFAYVLVREAPLAPVLAAVGGIGALSLLGLLVRGAEELLPWALGLLGAAYAIAIAARGAGVDEGAPLVAVALLLCGELAAWSLDERARIHAERRVVVLRATAVFALALAGIGASALVIGLAAARLGGGLAWTAAGAVAAVLVLAVVARVR
jgi:hypothetical protein